MSHHPLLPMGAFVDDEGTWIQIMTRPRAWGTRPALFLDRDGVVIEEAGFLSDPLQMKLIDGASDVIAHANRLGIPVIVVTNQSGIGRGMFGWDEFIDVQERMMQALARQGAFLDGVLACPHHRDGKPPYDEPDHPCRKPNPGMLLRATDLLPLDLGRSWIIGDRASDIAAGRAAGLAGGMHVRTGWGSEDGERTAALAMAVPSCFEVLEAPSIGAALSLLPMLSPPDFV